MNEYIVPLHAGEAEFRAVGGKGANLIRLTHAGFPVPPGFVVTTAAYRAFVVANGLDKPVGSPDGAALADDPKRLEVTSQEIRARFTRAPIPPTVAQAIVLAYRTLEPGAPMVAIRSSATAEDRSEASFAGQMETVLNVGGPDGESLLAAMKSCWAGLWTARAIAYRARHSEGLNRVELAVVVQRMVPAEVAGVLFTLNPITGKRDELVINAAWGLGEAVVAGRVTPDMLVLDRFSGRVLREELGEKSIQTVVASTGTVDVPVKPEHRRLAALSTRQVAELAQLGCAIEDHFGTPQDIEWAIAGGHVYILQARPATALPAVAATGISGDDNWPARGEHPPQPFDLWTQTNVGEVWPEPISPLVWSMTPALVNGGIHYTLRGLNSPYLARTQWAKRFYGRVYYNEGALAHVLSQELGLPASLVDGAVGGRRGNRDLRFRPLRFARRLPFLLRMITSLFRRGHELEALFSQLDDWVEAFLAEDLDRLDDRELWTLSQVWMDRFMLAMTLHTEMSSTALTAFGLLERLSGRWLGRPGLAQDLVAGLGDGLHATEMGITLWQMAQTLANLGLDRLVLESDPATALAWLRERPAARPVIAILNAFLQRHGHRCPNEGEWLNPRWADEPEKVIGIVAGYLRAGNRANPLEAVARQRRKRDDVFGWAMRRLDPVRRACFRYLLSRSRQAVRLRDNGKNCYMKAAYPMRRIVWQLGVRWANRGWLGQPEDIFFLAIEEIEKFIAAGDPASSDLILTARVAGRRKAIENWLGVRAPRVLDADGRPVSTSASDLGTESVLQGLPASCGRARGKARVIHDPCEAVRLTPDDVLVTRATDSGWTPFFPLVAGLVVEVGGQLSHAAIVAREYGIPAVVNVREATRRIQEGQTIIVDGTTGQIYLEDTEAEDGRTDS